MSKLTKDKDPCRKMTKCDAFGREIRLNLDGEENIRTLCGSFMTFLCFAIFAYYATLRIVSHQELRYDKFIPITQPDFFLAN